MSRDASRSRMIGAVAVVAIALATFLTATAAADTQFPPPSGAFTATITVGGTTYTYPSNGPGPTIPNVTDGQAITVTVSDTGPDASNFSSLRVRQCRPGVAINDTLVFNPGTFNRCSGATLGAGTPNAFAASGAQAPGTTSVSLPFVIGAGVAPDLEESPVDGNPYPGFTCGAGNPCVIVVNAEVTTGGGFSNYLSFPINFFVAPPTETVLMECNNLGGTGSVKAPLNNTIQPNVAISLKSTTEALVPGLYPKTCTGLYAASSGPLAKWAGKVTGNVSCSASATGPAAPYPPNGKFTFTWTTLDIKGKPLSSQVYVRLDQTADLIDDVSIASGIVTKGVGVGADVQGSMLLQPTLKNGPAAQSTIAPSGAIVPGAGSQTIATDCASGVGTIATLLASTDGATLAGVPFDSSIKLTLPA